MLDIGNKSSASFLIITKAAKKNLGVVVVQNRVITYMTCNFAVVDLCLFLNKHRSTTALEEILLDPQHHIARLAWLIQEYLFLVKK